MLRPANLKTYLIYKVKIEVYWLYGYISEKVINKIFIIIKYLIKTIVKEYINFANF